ncbi:MAG: hypothetical protein EBU93_06065 [Chlamydiae bacterium]|nr:hypothetical protein [Chlamydiota bacterium]
MEQVLLPLDEKTCKEYARKLSGAKTMENQLKVLSELHEEWAKDTQSFSKESLNWMIKEIGIMKDPQIEQSLPFRIHAQIVDHININQDGVAPKTVNLDGMDINLSEDDMKLYNSENFGKSKAKDSIYSGEFYKNISEAKKGKPIFDCINPDNKEEFAKQQAQLQIIAILEDVRRHEALKEAKECAEKLQKEPDSKQTEQILDEIERQEKVFVGLGGSEAFFEKEIKKEMKTLGVGKNSANTQKEKESVGPGETPWTDTRNTPQSQGNGAARTQ